MHHQQHSSAKSNCKDITGGTHQILAKTKAETFLSCLYGQGLFHYNSLVALPFPSSVEISARPHHRWLHHYSVPANCSTIMTNDASVEGKAASSPRHWCPRGELPEQGASCGTPIVGSKGEAMPHPIERWHGSLVRTPGLQGRLVWYNVPLG